MLHQQAVKKKQLSGTSRKALEKPQLQGACAGEPEKMAKKKKNPQTKKAKKTHRSKKKRSAGQRPNPVASSYVACPDPVAEARRQASIRRTAEGPQKLRAAKARVASAVSAGVAALRDRSPQYDGTLWPRLEGGGPVSGPPPRVRTLRVARRTKGTAYLGERSEDGPADWAERRAAAGASGEFRAVEIVGFLSEAPARGACFEVEFHKPSRDPCATPDGVVDAFPHVEQLLWRRSGEYTFSRALRSLIIGADADVCTAILDVAAFAPVLEELFVENRGCASMLGKPYRAPLPLLERPPTTPPFSKLRVVDVVTLLGDVQSMEGHLAAAILHKAPVLESVRLPIRVPRERPPAVQPTTIYVKSPHLRKLHLSFDAPAPAGHSPGVVVDVQSAACAALEDISLECMDHGFALECSNGCVKHGLASRPVPTAAVRLCAPLARARVVRIQGATDFHPNDFDDSFPTGRDWFPAVVELAACTSVDVLVQVFQACAIGSLRRLFLGVHADRPGADKYPGAMHGNALAPLVRELERAGAQIDEVRYCDSERASYADDVAEAFWRVDPYNLGCYDECLAQQAQTRPEVVRLEPCPGDAAGNVDTLGPEPAGISPPLADWPPPDRQPAAPVRTETDARRLAILRDYCTDESDPSVAEPDIIAQPLTYPVRDMLARYARPPGPPAQNGGTRYPDTPCRFYLSPSGCMRGASCFYRHG